MVQVYRSGTDRKIEVADGEQILKVTFSPDVEFVQDKPSKATISLFKTGKNHALEAELLAAVEGEGNTEKEALLKAIQNLIAKAQKGEKEDFAKNLEVLKGKVIAEGLGFAKSRYVPPSQLA
ncbi:hypothetical protein RF55_10063 [Lasius niger]|uniref:Uncharacterized protein n=1 Tax=Lasius niger TaxID=67767 RepID=A0A0J7KJ19_LASNI|nr:hypothetical protein RF55_10063 [Lasius niger]